jgi:UPF0716 protein FxsA
MTEARLLIKFLDRDYLFKLIGFLAAYSVVPIGEIIFFIYLGNLIGNYYTLALAAIAGVGGALAALGQAQRTLAKLKAKVRQGEYPGQEFVDIAGILAASLLLITPGFITDVLGYILLVPVVRDAVGRAIVKKLERSFHEIYGYLRLSLLSAGSR